MSSAALQVDYVTLPELTRQPPAWWQDVLAVVCFDGRAAAAPADIPSPEVSAAVLASPRAEVWRLAGPLLSGQRGRVRYRCGKGLLFAALSVPEAQFGDDALRTATGAAYGELFATTRALGFPHLLRFWNFLPDIHAVSGGAERYWHFNGARQDAFLSDHRPIGGDVPAASVLGTEPGSALTIYCIAGLRAPIALENPRQCSAWAYPEQYGLRRPSFARACLDDHAARTLFISGTASIVGHRSAHVQDPAAQTREVLNNIRALLDAANTRIGCERHAAQRLRYKVYVRNPEHHPIIERELRQQIGPEPQVLFLRADVCRRELLVEIEAVGM